MHPDEFNQLIRKKGKELILSSCYGNPSYAMWESRRKFISKAIDKDGTILDIGCANGFLLLCLLEWCKRKLIPYGIDNNEDMIKKSRSLMKEHKNNFALLSLSDFYRRAEVGLLEHYDFIYWAIWKDYTFEKAGLRELFSLLGALNSEGKLILGFYGSNALDLSDNKLKISFLKEKRFIFQKIDCPSTINNFMIILEKEDNKIPLFNPI